MTAIILADVSMGEIANLVLNTQKQHMEMQIDRPIDIIQKSIAQSVAESIRDMREGREDLRQ